MGFVSSLFGASNGAGFQAGAAPIQQATNLNDVRSAYHQANSGIQQQQDFLNALAAQNGIQNQSNVFNQLQGVANGTGPNPALAMLNQQTGQNVANQAALMAGQRGSGANAGLIARQAAQQGAGLQQQAVGQGAALQAQQQMNALGQLSGIAGQQVGQQAQALGGYNQAVQGEQGSLLNALANYNQNQVSMQNNMNQVNAGIAQGNQGFQQGLVGGGIKNLTGAVGGFLGMAGGGEVGNEFGVGSYEPTMSLPNINVNNSQPQQNASYANPQAHQMNLWAHSPQMSTMAPADGPQSFAGQMMNGQNNNPLSVGLNAGQSAFSGSPDSPLKSFVGGLGRAFSDTGSKFADAVQQNLLVPLRSKQIENVMQAPVSEQPVVASQGGKVKGKAVKSGDSYANDNVPAMLSPGEIVIPRSIAQHPEAPDKARAFVEAVLAKHHGMRKGK